MTIYTIAGRYIAIERNNKGGGFIANKRTRLGAIERIMQLKYASQK